jgi:hypothetical protein
MTKSPALGRRVTNSTWVVISCTTAAALAALDGFLGDNWNVAVNSAMLKNSAMAWEKEHVLAPSDDVRAIFLLDDPTDDVTNDLGEDAAGDDSEVRDSDASLRALVLEMGIEVSPGASFLEKNMRRPITDAWNEFNAPTSSDTARPLAKKKRIRPPKTPGEAGPICDHGRNHHHRCHVQVRREHADALRLRMLADAAFLAGLRQDPCRRPGINAAAQSSAKSSTLGADGEAGAELESVRDHHRVRRRRLRPAGRDLCRVGKNNRDP